MTDVMRVRVDSGKKPLVRGAWVRMKGGLAMKDYKDDIAQVVSLDTDIVVRRNIDHLFGVSTPAAALDSKWGFNALRRTAATRGGGGGSPSRTSPRARPATGPRTRAPPTG